MEAVRKGAEIEVEVEKLAFGGKGIARVDNMVLFVAGALPGQRVLVRVGRRKKGYAEARLIEVLRPSSQQVQPRCRHFGTCGGCIWQHSSYEAQLAAKHGFVSESLEHLGGITAPVVCPPIASPQIYFYRNKMEFTFAPRRWLETEELAASELDRPRDFGLGLHVRGFFDRVVDVEECLLQRPETATILQVVRRVALASGLAPYDTRSHKGFWRFLVVRDSKKTGEILVQVITAPHPQAAKAVGDLAGAIRREIAAVSTLIHGTSSKKAQVAQAEQERIIFGPGWIEESLGESRFRISAASFFQTNTGAAQLLLQEIAHAAALGGKELVWDLYCGTGAIALSLAPRARRVVGFELSAEALADAQINRGLNGIENCEFVGGDIKGLLADPKKCVQRYGQPHLVVTDPPRAGMHPWVVAALLEVAPERIVYVSCNPATMARDIQGLVERYRLVRVQPIDLFPHTAHVEAVALLQRR